MVESPSLHSCPYCRGLGKLHSIQLFAVCPRFATVDNEAIVTDVGLCVMSGQFICATTGGWYVMQSPIEAAGDRRA